MTNRDALQTVPGTGVRLVPPRDFTPADEFPGFAHRESATSIMVTVMPAPFAELSSSFERADALAQSGMRLIAAEDRPQGEFPGRLAHLAQTAGALEVDKWIWLFGSERTSVFVLGTCPDPALLESVHAAVVSARWDPDGDPDPDAGLGFRVDEVEGLVRWQRLGNSLAFTSDGAPDPEGAGKPMLMIGPALCSGAILDQRAFAEARVRELPLDDVQIRELSDVEIDGLTGCELLASAREPATGEPRSVLLVLLFEHDNYWIATGLCAASFEEGYFPRFRRAAQSLRRARK